MFDFKALIDALRGRAREDEYTGPSVTRLMADVPKDAWLLALTEIVKGIAALNRDSKVALRERYRAVLDFDEKARPLIHTLLNVYLGREKIEGVTPRHVMPSLVSSAQELANAYKLCLKQHAQSPSSKFAEQAELITLRGISYYALQAKWAYLRYFEPDNKVWRNLNRLYHIADSASFANKHIVRYEGEPATSVGEQYLRAALLKLAEPERRRPIEVWQIEEWLRTAVNRIKIEKTIRAREQTFGINLDEPKPPMKLRRNMIGERYRYLATETLSEFFTEAAKSMEIGMPRQLPTSHLDPADAAKLLTDLAIVYSRAGQTRVRRSERTAVQREVLAAIGLDAALELVMGNNNEAENWVLVDESASGMGAEYKARLDDRLSVGELFAIRDQEGRLALHVVRRLAKTREGLVHVGSERIATQPVMISLSHAGQVHRALFCNETAYGSRALVTHGFTWTPQDDFTLTAGGRHYGIKLGPKIDQFAEYQLTGFTVREKR
ncbi:MAG: hypothetical protein JO142_07470 [Burkholderiales bacterium]|nr:hypothetical protein [Burkholderiales bacterium]